MFNLQEEEQSILAEDEGVVQVPLEGYKYVVVLVLSNCILYFSFLHKQHLTFCLLRLHRGLPIINITDEMSKGSFGNTWNPNS